MVTSGQCTSAIIEVKTTVYRFAKKPQAKPKAKPKASLTKSIKAKGNKGHFDDWI